MSSVEFTDNSDKFKDAKNEAVQRALEAIGLTAEGYAKIHITEQGAVDTGNLRNSISHSSSEDSAYVGTNVEYARYVEFGTSKMPARPYIKPAVQNHINEYKQLLINELEKG